MYDRFTDRARKVMQLANQETQRFNHEYIGTEHILLGLVKEGTGVAALVLKSFDVDLRKIELEVDKLVERGPERAITVKLPQAPGATRIVLYAVEEARKLDHSFVGTEHLILGLLRVKEGVACKVLTRLGLELNETRHKVLELLGLAPEGDKVEVARKKRNSRTPALDTFTEDITELAREGALSPVIGRQKEIDQLTTVLCRRDCRSAMLIGDSGSGRRSVIHGMAQKIVEKAVRPPIVEYRIVLLDQALLVGGTKYRGQFEKRVKAMVNEMRRGKNILLFVPQIHSLARLGLDDDAGLSAFEVLKFAMLQNQINCVGTCTSDEYDEFVAADSDVTRLFQRIAIAPPTKTETLKILEGFKEVYESYHNVEVRDDALQAAVELSDIYLPDKVMPIKAMALIDEACSRLGLDVRSPDVYEIERQIETMDIQKEEAIFDQAFDAAAELRDKLDKLRKQKEAAIKKWNAETESFGIVDVENIVAALSLESGVSEQDIVDRKNAPTPNE